MRGYVAQRQRLPLSASRIASGVGDGSWSSNALADISAPGVQKTQTLTAFRVYSKGDLEQAWDIGVN